MTPHRITIDMKKSGYKQFVNIRQAENESHIIYISLTNGTEPIKLDNDMVATVYLEGISKQWESCDIVDNEIVFTVPILNMGDTKGQIQLSNDNGYSISPTFIIVAENILNVPHFELLEEEPDDWIDNADKYYTFDGTDYVPVEFNAERNLLKNVIFGSVPSDLPDGYMSTPQLDVDQGRTIYIYDEAGTYDDSVQIYVMFYYVYKNKTLSSGYTTLTNSKDSIQVPTLTKREKNEGAYKITMSCAISSTRLNDDYTIKAYTAQYDERTYYGCKTPYFEKGKFYAMVNDYGNVGNSYNALIQALQEARTYYNKAIKEVSMVDNCLVITYNDNTQYKSGDLKGDGIARLDKSTDGNVDTYTFVTDKGNTFSFNVTNADNTRIDDLYTQLGYKTPLTVFNNEVANLKELINDLDTKKESIEEHNKSISQLKNSLSIINTQLSVLNNNKVEKDTYTTAIESLQSLVTKLQNSKVDTNTYNDEIANLTTAISELNDKQIDTNAIKESITELDTKKLNKEEYNQYKENVANTFANTDNDIKANKTSVDNLSKDFNSYKTSNDNAVNSKVNTTDFNTYKTATDKAIADNTKSIKANTTAIDKCVTDIANNSALISKNQIKVTTDKGGSTTISDSSNNNIVGLNMYGKTTQSAIPTPTNPVDINDINNPKITVTNDGDSQEVNIQCTLRGIENVCDTLTVNADGTGYITQNLLYERLVSGRSQSGHTWRYSTTTKRFYRDDTRYKANAGTPNLLCSHFEVKDNERDTTLDETIGFTAGTGTGIAIRMLQFDGDISAFENWLDNNEVYILIPLKQPIITELSKEQVVDKILSLYTYYPSTTVICDSDFQLTYVADTKNYIDNKFNELSTAIVAHESEVN